MAIDFTRYQPPGVYTEAVGGPQLAVRSSVPTAVALFGQSIGYKTYRESVKINPDTDEDTPALNRTLAQKGIKPASVRVVDPNSGQLYVLGTDYVITRVSVGDDSETLTRDDLYTIQRVIDGGHIDPGDTVQLSYQYTDPDYFEVYALYDYDDVRDFYGEPFDSAGNIQSELSLAAKFAFINGASTVLTCAVDPEDPDTVTMADYADALDKFRDEELIAIIVPATGATAIQALVQQHVQAQSNNKYERRAIVGMDGSVTPVLSSQRIANAQAIFDQRVALVSPSSFQYYAPELNQPVILGGQYMAAALAGLSSSMNAAMPLTRKVVRGFVGPAENQREGEKNLESSNGLMVVEKTRRQQVQVRHGVTTNPTDLLTREWSIIGQQDVMVYRIRDYLDADGLIGMPIYDSTLIQVKASAEAALQSLLRDEIIRNYQGLKVRQIATLPDVLEIRYEWLPAYPLNYIVVRYSVAVLSGDITVNDTAL
ncbi:tail sheath [Mycobacterium phage Phabba]|uniref:Tail sheath protein n=1 Tax=Mycobacterium phage Phabba TaxID=2027899 RepID=A0A249XSL9_9CAUD|nr:tail sheath [Mycobacterium phage Phabba]ASZ74696.1 tail sheath protein [Mycobacterium phage Phabba]